MEEGFKSGFGFSIVFDVFHHGDEEGLGAVHEFPVGFVSLTAPLGKLGDGGANIFGAPGGGSVRSLVSNGVIGGGNTGSDVLMCGMALNPLEGCGMGPSVDDGLPHGSPEVSVSLEQPGLADGIVSGER